MILEATLALSTLCPSGPGTFVEVDEGWGIECYRLSACDQQNLKPGMEVTIAAPGGGRGCLREIRYRRSHGLMETKIGRVTRVWRRKRK